MPTFERVSTYQFPRAEVYAWHLRPGSMERLTPPGMLIALRRSTPGIAAGTELLLRLSYPLATALLPVLPGGRRAPIGVNWLLRYPEVITGERFVDEQVSGPFRRWRHEHHFADGPEGSTVLTDRIEWELPAALRPAQSAVAGQLAALFSFRERQLRADLSLHDRLTAAPRTVVLTGASGLVGPQVQALLTTGGHRVIQLVRRASAAPDTQRWDPASGQAPLPALESADVAINLSGHSIGGRFSSANKQAILLSRLAASATLARGLATAAPSATLVQASAIGYYGARRPGERLTEESAVGHGFLAEVVRAWEAAARPAADAGLRTAFLRTGIVLSGGGGALPPQLPLFAAGVGGCLAAADAWLSWVTLDDLARAYVHAALSPVVEGPINVVSPQPVTNQGFATTLGQVVRRPAALPTPALGPRTLLGAEGYDQLINTDQRVSADRLAAGGYSWTHPELAAGLRHVLLR